MHNFLVVEAQKNKLGVVVMYAKLVHKDMKENRLKNNATATEARTTADLMPIVPSVFTMMV
jgi:hypothetical protein